MVASTLELSNRAVITALEEKITAIQGQTFKHRQKNWRSQAQYDRKKTRKNTKWNSGSYRDKGDKHTNKINEGPKIKLYRGFKESSEGRWKHYSLLRMSFPTSISRIYFRSTKGGILYP